MSTLQELPNIGKELSHMLSEVDINTPEELKQVGTENTFLRLKAIDPGACLSKLCAIEGAIQGIRWHNIDPGRKNELRHFFEMIKKKPSTY